MWLDGYDKFVYLWKNDNAGIGVRPIYWEICEELLAANPELKDKVKFADINSVFNELPATFNP